jgi:hypothetical protein
MKTPPHVMYKSIQSLKNNKTVTVTSIGTTMPHIHMYPHQACQADQDSENHCICLSRPAASRIDHHDLSEREKTISVGVQV